MIDEIESDIRERIMADMAILSDTMRLFKEMRGAYAYKRASELYMALSKVLVILDNEKE